MEYTISEFAALRGISVQRARQLAREGKVQARREGRRWMVSPIDSRVRRTRRRLSEQRRSDLLEFLRTRNLDHVAGVRKSRLAAVVGQIRQSANPSALIREYFDGATPPEGPSGAAVIRAALRGLDEAANIALRSQHRLVIEDAATLGRRIFDARLIAGISATQLAAQVQISEDTLQKIERASFAGIDQVLSRKLAFAAHLNIAKLAIRQVA